MKKYLVLFLLFIVPLVAYMFFASGVNNFISLPVVKEAVPEFGAWKDTDGNPVKLEGNITVLGFEGKQLIRNYRNLFNVNQKLYNRYHEFHDLQFVYLCPEESRADALLIRDKFAEVIDMAQWHFVCLPSAEIKKYHESIGLEKPYDLNAGTPFVYLIDKQRRIRARKDDKVTFQGYDTSHPSIVSNELMDDFKVLLYEYKAALRKNKNAIKRPKGL